MPDNTGTSAIWVAQRVPDDHIAAVANMFVIRNVNLSDSYHFLGSSNSFGIAEKYNLLPKGSTWDSFDFTATFSDGEYGSKFYSGRRVWGFYSLFTALQLPDNYTNLKYDAVYPATAGLHTCMYTRTILLLIGLSNEFVTPSGAGRDADLGNPQQIRRQTSQGKGKLR